MIAVKCIEGREIVPVSIESFGRPACSFQALADGKPRKFVVAEVRQAKNITCKTLRIAASPSEDIFHKDLVVKLMAELKDGAACTPLYGGRIVISPVTKTIKAGGNSISYPDKMNPDEVMGLLKEGMHGAFSGYRVLCKEGLDDIKSLRESFIQ